MEENQVRKETEIMRVFKNLQGSVDSIEAGFEKFSSMVSPILRQNVPSAKKVDGINPEYSTPLAQELNSVVQRLNQLDSYIRENCSRVEL